MRILGTTAALVLGGGLLAPAAEPATLGIGSRVRVQQGPGKHGARLVGLVTATDAETLTLTLDQGQTRVVPWNTVQKIHVSRGAARVRLSAQPGPGGRGAGLSLSVAF